MRSLGSRNTISLSDLALFILSPILAATAAERSTLKIPDATPVPLVLADRLNSESSEVDDAVHLEVAEDVKIHGAVAIPRGAVAIGHVVSVQHRQRLGRAGKIELSVDFVRAPDGTDIRLRAGLARQGKGRGWTVFVPARLIGRGNDLEIPQGTHILAFVNGDREIAWENSSVAPTIAREVEGPATPSAASDKSSVSITSTPDHADITLDGKFFGTTPSTLRLPPGDHTVTIEKTNFKAWQRVLTLIPGGNVSLDVTLEKIP